LLVKLSHSAANAAQLILELLRGDRERIDWPATRSASKFLKWLH
jgi:hypothetical protein